MGWSSSATLAATGACRAGLAVIDISKKTTSSTHCGRTICWRLRDMLSAGADDQIAAEGAEELHSHYRTHQRSQALSQPRRAEAIAIGLPSTTISAQLDCSSNPRSACLAVQINLNLISDTDATSRTHIPIDVGQIAGRQHNLPPTLGNDSAISQLGHAICAQCVDNLRDMSGVFCSGRRSSRLYGRDNRRDRRAVNPNLARRFRGPLNLYGLCQLALWCDRDRPRPTDHIALTVKFRASRSASSFASLAELTKKQTLSGSAGSPSAARRSAESCRAGSACWC